MEPWRGDRKCYSSICSVAPAAALHNSNTLSRVPFGHPGRFSFCPSGSKSAHRCAKNLQSGADFKAVSKTGSTGRKAAGLCALRPFVFNGCRVRIPTTNDPVIFVSRYPALLAPPTGSSAHANWASIPERRYGATAIWPCWDFSQSRFCARGMCAISSPRPSPGMSGICACTRPAGPPACRRALPSVISLRR